MSAPVFYPADPSGLAALGPGDTWHLDGPEGRHAATVRRIRAGETVQLCDGDGRRLTGTVTAAERDALTVRVDAVHVEEPPAPALILAQALAKGDRDLQAVETATELGVDVVVPWQADRSIVRWRADRGGRSAAKWEATIRAAAQQSRRARVPRLDEPAATRALAARIRDGVAAGTLRAVVLHEEADRPLTAVLEAEPVPDAGALLLVVGPEGGIGQEELAELTGAGAATAVLGPHVLRSSTAGPAALVLAAAALGRWTPPAARR